MITGPWVGQYPAGIDRELPPVTDDVVHHLGLETVDPGQVALRCGERALGYGELAEAHQRVAGGLAAAGVRPGDRVAVVAGTSPEHLVVLLAALRLADRLVPHGAWILGYQLYLWDMRSRARRGRRIV